MRANWAWGISKYPYTGKTKEIKNTSDFDSMAINIALDEAIEKGE